MELVGKVWLTIALGLSVVAQSVAQDTDALRSHYQRPIAEWPKAETADNVEPAPLAPLLPTAPLASEKQIALGRQLFHDPILSRDNSVSCANCHFSAQFFQDGKTTATGIDNQQGKRNAPPLFGIDHWQSFFWDGRAQTATEQALKPIEDHTEMDLPVADALDRLNKSDTYKQAFSAAFGKPVINSQMLAMALVAFERSIPAPDTLYQRFINAAASGADNAVDMLNDQQLHGLHLYRTKAKCMTCHEGALLSDNEFHVTGFHNYGRRFEDFGRGDFTQNSADIGKFRTPSLLAVSHTGPWMHNGLFTEFKPMIMQYNAGGFKPKPRGRKANDPYYPYTTNLLVPLGMSDEELDALVAFLKTL